MADALVAVVEVALAKQRQTFGALAPATTVAVGHAAEATVAAVHRLDPPFDVSKQIGVLLLTDRAAAHLGAVRETLPVKVAKLPPAVLAHGH